jgi:redox-sensitive bicupin YhaK (pirin superfamily)
VRTFSPLFYLHAELGAGARIAMPTDHAERAAYVVSGSVAHEGVRYEAGRMLVFADGGEPVIAAEDAPARVMLLGGASIGPRHIWWNLVSSRRERIEQAKADWKSGRMALPPDDDHEFIPLPDDPPPPPEPTPPV